MYALIAVAAILLAAHLVRRRIRQRIEQMDDPMTWAEFEEQHGEAEYKDARFAHEHESFLEEGD